MNTMAMSAPGSFFDTRGVRATMAMVAMPTSSVATLIVPKLRKYTIHFEMKSPGTPPSIFSPNRSTICVENIVSAMPLVNPTTMG